MDEAVSQATEPHHLRARADELCGIVAALDPDDVLASQAPKLWEAFDRIERLAGAAKILLARRVEDSKAHERDGLRTPAEYLAKLSGSSIAAGRGALATSKRIPDLLHTQEALRRGELSASQVEAIADAASHNPDAEQRLVAMASRASLGELRDECARRKAAGDPDPDATYRRIHQNRCVRQRRDGEGGWNLSARGTPDAGALFNSVLDPIIDQLFKRAWAQGRREDRERYAFDGLLEMARRARHGHDPHQHEIPDEGDTRSEPGIGVTDEHPQETSDSAPPNTERRKPRRADNPNYLALLRIDLAALQRGHVNDGELCEIAGLGPIPVTRARQLLGDAVIKLIVTKGQQVVNVTHYGRRPTTAQRMALLWSQPGCTVAGCNHSFTEIDHRVDWHKSRQTRLEDLDRLCPHHHRLKTHHGWALIEGTGKRPMVPPEDPRHPNNQRRRTHSHAA
jgi:hypothetical protein